MMERGQGRAACSIARKTCIARFDLPLKDTMRRLAAFLLPVLALSACVGPAYGPSRGGGRYDQRASERWYDREDLPLAARITQHGSYDFAVDLNRPAYVA